MEDEEKQQDFGISKWSILLKIPLMSILFAFANYSYGFII